LSTAKSGLRASQLITRIVDGSKLMERNDNCSRKKREHYRFFTLVLLKKF